MKKKKKKYLEGTAPVEKRAVLGSARGNMDVYRYIKGESLTHMKMMMLCVYSMLSVHFHFEVFHP